MQNNVICNNDLLKQTLNFHLRCALSKIGWRAMNVGIYPLVDANSHLLSGKHLPSC